MVGADPMARQAEVEREAGSFAGERTYGTAANLPPRVTGGSQGAGGEGKPSGRGAGMRPPAGRGRKPNLDEMGPGREEAPTGADGFVRPEKPDPAVSNWRKGGRGRRG